MDEGEGKEGDRTWGEVGRPPPSASKGEVGRPLPSASKGEVGRPAPSAGKLSKPSAG